MFWLEDLQLCCIWCSCIEDYDGGVDVGGGIWCWLVLVQVVGLDFDYVVSGVGVLFVMCFVVDVYVCFVCDMLLLDVVVVLLMEMFVFKIYVECIEGLLKYYDFVDEISFVYFCNCLIEVCKDVEFGLIYVLDYVDMLEKQDVVVVVLMFKIDVFWVQFDVLWNGYVEGCMFFGVW